MTEAERREEIVKEARSWIGTPYHPNAQKKGAGCSCATLLYKIMLDCGIVPEEKIENYPNDWFCHVSEDIYTRRLIRLLRYTIEPVQTMTYPNADIKPACIILLKCGSRYNNHSGIVTQWPYVIHGIHPAVSEINATSHYMWTFKKVMVFDPLLNRI